MFRIYFLLPLLIPLVLTKGDWLGKLCRPVERWGDRLALKPGRAVAFVGAVSLILVMGLTLFNRVPAPCVADEFGYLLLGDSFAHGHITNPTPPLWQHFETIHEIMQPTYTAKYPPGQGVALAFGEWFGWPIIGIWISTALACATMCWMFMAWMPPRWALAGGLLVAFHPRILEWSQNYWGGAVALGGGALLLGAFRRIVRQPRVRDTLWMATGMAILANTRPYEGFVLSMLTLLALLLWFIEAGSVPVPVVVRRVLLPLLIVLPLLAFQIGFYNWRVTGNPAVMPYMVHEETYGLAPLFLFGTPRPEPQYRHPQIRRLQELYLRYYQSQRQSFRSLMAATGQKIATLAQGYLWSYLMVVALLGLPWALLRDRWLWFALFIGCFFTLSVLMGTWVFNHYVAPAASLFFVLVVQSLRSLRTWRAGLWRPGRNLARGLAILFVISYFQVAVKMVGAERNSWFEIRQQMIDALSREPGKSLVIVKYDPDHNPNREWVYNVADMPNAKVILARDMGGQNQELVNYFKDRKPWIIHADASHPALEPYPGS